MKKWLAFSFLCIAGTTMLMFNAKKIGKENLDLKNLLNTKCMSSILIDDNNNFKEYFIFLKSRGIGCIAVNVREPTKARFTNASPQILITPTFFTPPSYSNRFSTESPDIYATGAIEYNFLLPSRCVNIKTNTGSAKQICSSGSRDRGGKESQQAMHSVLKYMLGTKVDSDGEFVTDKFPLADVDNVGAFAFSHPGLLLNTTLARWGDQLKGISYVVMRENPTQSLFASVELGDIQSGDGCNPIYNFSNYHSDFIELDYSKVKWRLPQNRPYFDLNDNNNFDHDDFSLHTRIPELIENDGSSKNLYSHELLKSLYTNIINKNKTWVSSLVVSEEEAFEFWNGRVTLGSDFDGNKFNAYDKLVKVLPNLKQVIVFAEKQHVQACPDAPSIHQAYDGYLNNQMWSRINPDEAYLSFVLNEMGYGNNISLRNYNEIAANDKNLNWRNGSRYGHSSYYKGNVVSLAAIMEMMDRTHFNKWAKDLSSVLYSY